MNPRNKATLIDASQDLLGQFSNPKYKEAFCAVEDKIDFPGIKSLLDAEKIIALDTTGVSPKMVQTIGILLKLEYQRIVLARLHSTEKPPFTFFMCDEYKFFASTSDSGSQGDDYFVSLSREANCMNIVLLQSPVDLVAKLGEAKARVLMANFRSKVFLALTDSKDAKLASEICGEQWENITSQTFTERAKATKWNPVVDKVDGRNATIEENVTYSQNKRALFDPIDFQQLQKFQALASIYDGKGQRTTKLYLKPVFEDITTPYSELYERYL